MRALTRRIPATFAKALVAHAPGEPIDLDRARAQHDAYVAALRSLGVEVIDLPAIDDHPDCCFVEDCALVAGGVALVTNPGAPSRRGEVETIAEALRGMVTRVERTGGDATIDGGDCLRIGKQWFIGLSGRTNEAG